MTQQIDHDMVSELKLFAENNFEIYSSTHLTLVKNYRKKMQDGRYNSKLALKDIRDTYIRRVLARYAQEIRPLNIDRYSKEILAKQILGSIHSDIRDLNLLERQQKQFESEDFDKPLSSFDFVGDVEIEEQF
jgi:hypothetical protein